jgi:hypothetical protein
MVAIFPKGRRLLGGTGLPPSGHWSSTGLLIRGALRIFSGEAVPVKEVLNAGQVVNPGSAEFTREKGDI